MKYSVKVIRSNGNEAGKIKDDNILEVKCENPIEDFPLTSDQVILEPNSSDFTKLSDILTNWANGMQVYCINYAKGDTHNCIVATTNNQLTFHLSVK